MRSTALTDLRSLIKDSASSSASNTTSLVFSKSGLFIRSIFSNLSASLRSSFFSSSVRVSKASLTGKRWTTPRIIFACSFGEELENIDNGVHYSPERIQEVNDKISLGYKLLKKHNVNTTAELLAIKHLLQQKLTDILNIGETIVAIEQATEALLKNCCKHSL